LSLPRPGSVLLPGMTAIVDIVVVEVENVQTAERGAARN
jgi:hypothetical protein